MLSETKKMRTRAKRKPQALDTRTCDLDGAGGGGRTRTVLPPTDFESVTSANSITPALMMYCINNFNIIAQRTFFVKCACSCTSKAAAGLPLSSAAALFYILVISTSSTSFIVLPDSSTFTSAFAVSMAVRLHIERSMDLRRIFTLSRSGSLPFAEVEIT